MDDRDIHGGRESRDDRPDPATDPGRFDFDTRAIHAGQEPDPDTGALMTPIHANSTFEQDGPGDDRGHEYARTSNPTREDLEANLAALEEGTHCRAFASGMAAIDAVLGRLSAGDRVVCGGDVYGGTYRILTDVYERYGFEVSFVDTTDLDAVADAVGPDVELVWLETPTNPLMAVTDVGAVAEIAHDAGAECAIDNTFATPYLQRPLELGADVVVHSLTKYLGGHSDLVAGAVVTEDSTIDDEIAFHQNAVGGTPSPFDCFLVLRGVKTLPVRMDRHCENARAVAGHLADHPEVDRVYYPGLPDHPGHEIAREQMDDFGGMLSFELDATLEEAGAVVSNTSVFTLAESLGGVESLIEQPAAMTHATIPREERLDAGLTDGLIRVSVGVEDREDLIGDLDAAIGAVL
ncbi:cystathionine gamma-synthase [Halobacteriales archaeon SW_7_68_16]|nr:MAG: cystathionine gamma-synthase [Halobacteriales archaeon SW_7_68_16]